MPSVILDISRLISRVRHATPSGVDRVEMAYARGLQRIYGENLHFAAVHPTGLYGRIDTNTALAYLDELEKRWSHEDGGPAQRSLLSVLPWLIRLRPKPAKTQNPPAIYVQASPHHLTHLRKVQSILAKENARFICLMHDLIPIEFPEYARPSGAALHQRRVETVIATADSIIANSAATARSLEPWIARSGRMINVQVALLGTQTLPPASSAPLPSPPQKPYFLCLGTIEPRKNHLLLLHIWRHFAQTLPASQIPRLILVGRRGWENEQVLDLLERCPALRDHVEERSGCPDHQLSPLLKHAQALLMPSFAEGYGMPVAEALAVGTPVLCSDIPALREVGGCVPEYIDPLDGPKWIETLLAYSSNNPMIADQKDRMKNWHTPTWADHLAIVNEAICALDAP